MINNVMRKKHYDWAEIQKDYNNGLSYRGLNEKYGVTFNAIANAKKRGDLVTRTVSEGMRLRLQNHPPNKPGLEARKATSKRMSENNPGGRSQWYEVNGVKVQGTWERDFALWLTENKVTWIRPKSMVYVKDGVKKRYTPDFYLPYNNLYIEIKGYWWGDDRKKMDLVLEQHQDKNFLIIENKNFAELADVVIAGA